jgi:methyltransferase (TIGR00027 family)
MSYEFVRGCAALMAPRTIAIDDATREHPTEQLVILGAGLDTRAWRMGQLADTIAFEVDHPTTQADKRERLGQRAPAAKEVRFVATDFAHRQLGEVLDRAGHRVESPTLWLWEGVVPYLEPAQVAATVAAVESRSVTGSRLVVNYQAQSARAGIGQVIGRAMMRMARTPDPWSDEPHRSHWTPEQLSALLGEHAFTTVHDRDLLEISSALGLPRPAGDLGGSLPNGHVLVAERR